MARYLARRIQEFGLSNLDNLPAPFSPSTPQLLARDLQLHAHLRARRRADRGRPRLSPQLSLNSAALDRRGVLAVYLRPEKSWFKFPIHILTGSVYGS